MGLRTLLGSALALAWQPLAAQDQSTTPALEDLIPDSAVENPEAWAQQSEAAAAVPEAAIDPDTPTDELPGVTLAWPDTIDLPPLPELAPEPEVQYADLDLDGPQLAFADAQIERISDDLVLGFPQVEPAFGESPDFSARFSALSTVKQLDSDSDNLAQLGARAREDQQLLENLLRVYGYYDGQVIRSIANSEPGEARRDTDSQVRFDVVPGIRYSYGTVDLGKLGTAPDAAALRAAFEIQPGDFLQSDTIVQERADLDVALGETGYPFASIADPELLIDHERRQGDLTMLVDPRGKYNFSLVTSNDETFLSSRHLSRIARFAPGDVYQRSLEFDLRRAILATGLVSSVTLTPREVTPPQGDQPGTVAMDVQLQRAKTRTLAGAIGYGTEEGFRVEASWEHRNLFPPEGMLRVRGIAGTQEQLGGVTLRFNNFRARDQVLTFDAYASAQDNAAFDANTVALSARFERLSNFLFQKPFSWALGAEVLYTDERNREIEIEVPDGDDEDDDPDTVRVPRPRQEYFIAGVQGRATIDTSDSLLDPTRGFRLTGFVAPEASRTQGQQYFYVRTQLDASYYQQFGDQIVGAARVRLASIPGAPLEAIAPSRRLYAGGGGSVRGYGFQAIGPRDDIGQPIGGRSLSEISIEARIKTGFFGGALSVVPFFDAGAVGVDPLPGLDALKFGAGIGVRYATSFGPLRLDVGVPLNPEPDDNFVAVYISLGQAF
ncbi:autotransporter assembly complex protein TamA [Qipengyuania sediminis]|uniref:autotransporter assembly complex protein TamA n=1 Tax=Qipengyuania sediminis TaxID=1532023 RepID=UPI0010594DE7|nr:BamA/TamA family outer membrane protein [Qipengyuania sediminis]